MTTNDHLFKSLHCCTWTGCLLLFTKLFFPFCALWHFSAVSPVRRAFGCSRFPDNEIPLFFCPCMLRPGSPAWSCGGSVSPCLTGWDRLVSGHRPRQLGNTKCVFISVFYIQFNAIVWEGHEKWKAIVKKIPKHSCAIRQILRMCSYSCHAALEVMSGDSPVNTNKTGVCRAAPVESSFDVDPCRLTWPLISFSVLT